jgi:hypothetical protein
MATQDNSIPKGSTPVPDPTILTTQQLYREIAASREIIEANIGKIETRLEGMDKATELNKAATDKIPELIAEKICQLRKLCDEKFESIAIQFRERDIRADKIAELGQKALEAALSAAKEAVGKTEIAFTKQIDSTSEQIQAEKRATDGKFEDVKARLGTLEASINTRSIVTTEGKQQQGWLVPMIVLGFISLIGIAISVLTLIQIAK